MYVEDVEDGKITYTYILAHNFLNSCMVNVKGLTNRLNRLKNASFHSFWSFVCYFDYFASFRVSLVEI